MRMQPKQFHFVILVILIGMVGGLGAIFFRDLIAIIHNLLFYGQFSLEYDVLQHAEPSRWGVFIIFIPVIGAILVTYLVKNYAPEAKGHGVPEVIDAIHYKHGRIRPQVAVVKSLASSISIGSGGSIGREGPIIQIGAAFGSMVGQWFKVAEWQLAVLVSCGAAAGIAATFNTPLAGVLFASEVMLIEVSTRTVLPVCIATAIATYVSYVFLGQGAFIPITAPLLTTLSFYDVAACLFLSIIFGLFSWVFIRAIYWSEDLFEWIPGNDYVRHMLGMFLLGVIMYLMLITTGHYYIQGVGYATVWDVLTSSIHWPWFLLFLACLKLICTCITLGSGGSGGIFSPLLFMGATLGAGMTLLMQLCFPSLLHISIPFGALAGIAGLIGASTGAYLTAIVITAELTQQYLLLLPLLIIVAVSASVRRLLLTETIYTYKLMLRQHYIPEERVAPPRKQ